MEELIKQAFVHVDVIGPHVQAGHYDLIGPNGEIILPAIWEKVIEPDWSVTMHMWPMEQRPPLNPMAGRGMPPNGIPNQGRPPMPQHPGMFPQGQRRPGVGPMPRGPPPPPNFPGGDIPIRPQQPHPDQNGGMPPGINIVHAHKPKKSSSKAKPSGAMLGFFTGKPPKSTKK